MDFLKQRNHHAATIYILAQKLRLFERFRRLLFVICCYCHLADFVFLSSGIGNARRGLSAKVIVRLALGYSRENPLSRQHGQAIKLATWATCIILGSVPRSADLIRRFGPLPDEFLSAAEESEFSGDPVETCAIPT